jgi:biotin carboxylase
MSRMNVVVLGLDQTNLDLLKRIPDADRYEFHPLMSIHDMQSQDGIPIGEILDTAEARIAAFDGDVHAIVGFWDFPVSTIVPVLCERFGLRGARLDAVLRCEHKYWSRLVQREVIDEYPPFAVVDLDAPRLPAEVGYPCWLKPVKSFSSKLAFEVTDEKEFADAVERLREGIGTVGEPFEYLLKQVDLPPEIAEAGGQAALAERALSGDRAAVEGYVRDGEVVVYGVLDSLVYPGVASFLRHQYPSQQPDWLRERLADVSRRVIAGIGLDNTTFSIEYFCDPATGEVNLLEINPRHSQAHAELFEHVDGYPNHRYMVNVALGETPAAAGDGPYAISARWYLRRFTDGTLLRGPAEDEIAALERDIDGVRVYRKAPDGTRLSEGRYADSYSYELAQIIVGAADEDQLAEKYERCVAALRFEFAEEAEEAERGET